MAEMLGDLRGGESGQGFLERENRAHRLYQLVPFRSQAAGQDRGERLGTGGSLAARAVLVLPALLFRARLDAGLLPPRSGPGQNALHSRGGDGLPPDGLEELSEVGVVEASLRDSLGVGYSRDVVVVNTPDPAVGERGPALPRVVRVARGLDLRFAVERRVPRLHLEKPLAGACGKQRVVGKLVPRIPRLGVDFPGQVSGRAE